MADTLGGRLRAARDYALMTQAELSQVSGVSIVQISRLENNEAPNPRPTTVKRLATALGISPTALLWGEGELFPKEKAA